MVQDNLNLTVRFPIRFKSSRTQCAVEETYISIHQRTGVREPRLGYILANGAKGRRRRREERKHIDCLGLNPKSKAFLNLKQKGKFRGK